MRKIIFATGACALALSGAAQAQNLPGVHGGATVLDTITVTTPLRRASSLERSTSSVTIIGEEEIRHSAAVDLPSLLKIHTGVSVGMNGGIGSSGGAAIRGTKPSQTLVLLNGIRISSATSASVSLFNIPLDSIERIEVAKGAHSAQYGADAIGGIINIITHSGGPCANGNDSCATATLGAMHPWGGKASANVAGRTGDGWDYAFGASLFGTRGYDFTRPTFGNHEPDDDGFGQGSLHYSIAKDHEWGRIYSNGLVSRARTQYDNNRPTQPNETETDTLAGKAGVRLDHSQSWSTTLEFSVGSDNVTNFRKAADVDNVFDSTRFGVLALTEKSFATDRVEHVVALGAEAYREQIDSTGNYAVTRRDLAALFGQHSLEFGGLTVDSGLRYDHNEQFGDATTYNIGASYAVLPDLTLRASYGTGFRAPSFNDLYYSTPGIGRGNPDLRPERSRSWEVGLNWHPTDATSLDMAFYRSLIKDQIEWDSSNFPAQPMFPANLERVSVSGFEATLSHSFDERWSARASVDIRRPVNDVTGNYVPLQDRFKASVEVDFRATEKLYLRAGVFHVGTRSANAANTQEMPAYTTVDLTGIYRFDEQSELKLSVENLFDERYERIRNYYAMGRTINVSFSRTF